MRASLIALALLSASAAVADQDQSADQPALIEAGRKIYQEGILPNGEPLKGRREDAMEVSGPAAACILCHRRSGMGAFEGQKTVPPVIGAMLFDGLRPPGGRRSRHAPGVKLNEPDFRTRPAYDEANFARAMREGLSTSGYRFHYLMPRYVVQDDDLRALSAYLRSLQATPSPGAEGGALHFATVITPGADVRERADYLAVLRACIAERQSARAAATGGWQLHVWELNGSPDTWEAQLAQHYAARPVFAMLSGLGRDEWAPIHRYCESNRIPCLFPNTDLPGAGDESVYNFYFSRGVLLDANLLAAYAQAEGAKLGIKRVLQVIGGRGAASAGARQLRAGLEGSGLTVVDRAYAEAGAIRLGPEDGLVLWLDSRELAEFTRRQPVPNRPVFVSGTLGGFEQAPLPPAWRRHAYLLYPVDAAGRWELRARFNLRPWLSKNNLPQGDERLQGNTLAACTTAADAVYRSRGLLMRDYLLENVENAASTMGNSGATAAFPRFLLGTNQRFASKGGYLARFAESKGAVLKPASDWIVP